MNGRPVETCATPVPLDSRGRVACAARDAAEAGCAFRCRGNRALVRKPPWGSLVAAVLFAAATLSASPAHAAPHRPVGDDTVLERLSPAVVALRALRGITPAATDDLAAALTAARRYIEIGCTYADPRAYGYAQA